jgi:PAS domain-containing protein
MGSLGRQRAATSTKLSLVTIERPSAVRFCSLYSVRNERGTQELKWRDLVTSRQKQWLDQVGSVLESLNQGVIISDEDRRIIFANSMFLEMGKMSAETHRMIFPSCFSKSHSFLASEGHLTFPRTTNP